MRESKQEIKREGDIKHVFTPIMLYVKLHLTFPPAGTMVQRGATALERVTQIPGQKLTRRSDIGLRDGLDWPPLPIREIARLSFFWCFGFESDL